MITIPLILTRGRKETSTYDRSQIKSYVNDLSDWLHYWKHIDGALSLLWVVSTLVENSYIMIPGRIKLGAT